MVGQANSGECEVEAGWSAHPVEVEAVNIEDVGVVQRRAEHFASELVLPDSQPQFGGGPVEVVGKVLIAVRSTAESALVIGCDQLGILVGSATCCARCCEQPIGILNIGGP
jgi:hypothetical protein